MYSASARNPAGPLERPSSVVPKVFVVDDDISVRESLESLIRCAGWQPETFASAEEFLSHPRGLLPSCVVLDYWLPDLDGLEVQKRLAADGSHLPIIFITYYGDPTMAVQAMKGGALEILSKPFGDDVLLSAIHEAIGHSRLALVRENERRILRDCYETLSGREREVMAFVVGGLLNKQIAGELQISEITVKAHRGRVMAKMKAHSLAELVSMGLKLGLESVPRL